MLFLFHRFPQGSCRKLGIDENTEEAELLWTECNVEVCSQIEPHAAGPSLSTIKVLVGRSTIYRENTEEAELLGTEC
jgi:hypothetical protein